MSDVISFNTDELAKVKPTKTTNIVTYNLVDENDPVLYQPVKEWDFSDARFGVKEANEFASSLVETCIKNRGLGLSANQCGFPYKVFVAGYDDNYVAYFNPKVLKVSDSTEIAPEGCLSFPHLFLSVHRPKWVEVEYQDFNGEKHSARFEGLTARVFLHEYDHMEGIVFTNRAKPLALKSGVEKRNKLFNKLKKAQKQLSKLATEGKPN
jgi:peptide deformylase